MRPKLVRKVFLPILVFVGACSANGQGMFGYSFGVSTEQEVLPGSRVFIRAALKNTGTTAIVFAPAFPGGLPSDQGGSVPGGGLSYGTGFNALERMDWGPDPGRDNFGEQFESQSIAPGEVFNFTFGNFLVPTDLALGEEFTLGINFRVHFTDSVYGNLLGIANYSVFDYSYFNNRPHLQFTTATSARVTPMQFFDGLVVDLQTGYIHSAPDGWTPRTPIPEPSSFAVVGCAFLALICGYRLGARGE